MITFFIRRVLPILVLAAVLVAAVQRIHVDTPSSDMWFHLRMGREFLDGWSIRKPGHLGVFDSAEWTPTQWLPQIVMASMEDVLGVAGVIWLAGVSHVALILIVYVTCRRDTASMPAALATAMCFLALTFGLSPRPQVLSFILVALTVSAWLSTEQDGRPRWWLIAVAWIWAPLHGMWPLAPLIGLVCVTGIALDRTYERRVILRLAAIPVLSAVAPLLTPAGPDLYRAVLLVGGRSEYFVEWGPTDFHKPYALVLAVMLAIVTVHLARTRGSWLSVLLLLTSGAWAVYSARTTPVAAVIAAPLVARALQTMLPASAEMRLRERLVIALMGVAAVGSLGPIASARAKETVVPSWTDARLDELPDGAKLLDDWASGPYLLWRHPDLSLVMHGYGDVFTDAEIERNRIIMQLEPGWQEHVERLDVDAAVVETDTPLGWALRHDKNWTVIEQDDEFIFLLPRT